MLRRPSSAGVVTGQAPPPGCSPAHRRIGASAQLVADPTQADRDQYDRLLRYVQLPDGTDLGSTMISDGNADEYTYDVSYE